MSAELREVVVVPGAGEGPELDIVAGEGTARAVIWPGMGATLRSLHRLSLGADARTVELTHPSDAVYYVISGGGSAVDRTTGERSALVEGSMVHVDAGTPYELVAGGGGMELVGGPCPADASLYERVGG
jgi:mannose-6-phosphate isomerase-like protein (cupin superfamily)